MVMATFRLAMDLINGRYGDPTNARRTYRPQALGRRQSPSVSITKGGCTTRTCSLQRSATRVGVRACWNARLARLWVVATSGED